MKKYIVFIVELLTAFVASSQPLPQSQCWRAAVVGRYHTVAIKSDGTLHCWGHNFFGQLGDGSHVQKLLPTQCGIETDWKAISGGRYHSLAMKLDGSLWSFGGNATGQLGLGNLMDTSLPVKIGNATWLDFDAGGMHSHGIQQNGTLWGWGQNALGQLGDGSTSLRNSPVQIGTDNNWKIVSAGEGGHSAAIKQDHTIWTWGWNNSGQLGLGNNTNTLVPMQVGTANDWKMVSAGYQHTLAIKADGTLWAWGQNAFGQLGTGNTSNSNIPVQIGTDTNWKMASAGVSQSAAVKTDGTIYTWGVNDFGQLGNGSFANSNSPVQMTWTQNWKEVSINENHCLGVLQNNTLMIWGRNNNGQLGDSTNHNRNYPLPVIGHCCKSNIPANLSNGLIAAYTFADSQIIDFSGNVNHLSNHSGAVPAPDRNGNANCAYRFNRNNDQFLYLGAPSFIDGITVDSFSVSLWYKPIGLRPMGDYEQLIGRDSGLHCPDTYGQWSIGLGDCRKAVAGVNKYSVWQTSSTFCDTFYQNTSNQWHHLALVYSPKNYQLFVDGILYNSLTGPCGNAPTNFGAFLLGKNYTGDLDDVLMYNRRLTANEVNQLMNLGSLCCNDGFNTLNTQNVDTEKRIIVYPNPTNSILNISKNAENKPFEMFDLSGRLVLSGVVDHSGIVNIGLLKNGIYFFKIEQQYFKILVQ